MLLFYILGGYLLGSIPNIYFLITNLDTFVKKSKSIPKSGISISYYPFFSWQYFLLIIDVIKIISFYFLLDAQYFTVINFILLGYVFPFWKINLMSSVFLFFYAFIFYVNIYFFFLLFIFQIIVQIIFQLQKELLFISVSLFLSIFYWVSGADINFVLLSILFFVLFIVYFIKNNRDKISF
jgi:hypothetical protein